MSDPESTPDHPDAASAEAAVAPAGLPAEPDRFWAAGDRIDEAGFPPEFEDIPALRRLGPPPFARAGFPLVGFLETVYEHIAAHARDADRRNPPALP